MSCSSHACLVTRKTLQASRTTAQGLWVALIFGTLAGVGIYQGAPFFLQRIGASPDITVHALAYLRCRAIACPALLSLFVATGSFRGFQDTKCAPVPFSFPSLPVQHSLTRVLPGTPDRGVPSCAF